MLIGTDAETVAQRIAELSQQLSHRMKEHQLASGGEVRFKDPDIVVILDGSRRLRSDLIGQLGGRPGSS